MKQLLFFSIAFLMLGFAPTTSNAKFKLLGIEISIDRGKKEWNGDKTDVKCVGRGLCMLTFKGNAELIPVTDHNGPGKIGFFEDGTFGMALSGDFLKNRAWAETFAGGFVYIDADIEITDEIRNQLSNCPRVIRAGRYPYTIEDNTIYIRF